MLIYSYLSVYLSDFYHTVTLVFMNRIECDLRKTHDYPDRVRWPASSAILFKNNNDLKNI